ncbi:hypothetical protein P3X46_008667 [Hevea brasiliensis]|uniref:Uncharacterized protein n=1 Tax=Hevea brasiliensis TaxID=3981 RepID=A0ABQ9MLE3_HEVBR|nr:uncharacterized protein LOC110644001 isoform X2 [Hevea brasiliensis]KAJ9180420.1 hypothetical protein P3X46_008667 [Hevea brasiliensis]
MEEQAMERENQECEENSGKMSRILDKGLALGKKMLITGFVISSAPVVLPPLVVLSALGFAVSVPYGLFLASYACTEKIMSKLLPSPTTPPPFVEDGLTRDGGEDAGFGGNVEMENEEEVLKTRGEMRFDTDEKRNEDEVNVLKGELYAQKGFEKEEKEILNNKDEVVEKNGYEEDVDEDVDKEEDSLKEIEIQNEGIREKEKEELLIGKNKDATDEIQIEGIREKEKEEPLIEENNGATEEICGVMIVIEGKEKSGGYTKVEEVPFEVTNVAVELCQGGDNEGKELVSETTGLVEKIRDEGKTDKGVDNYKQSAEDVHGGVEEGLKETDQNVEETVTQLGDGNATDWVGIEARSIDQKVEEKSDKVSLLENLEVEQMGATGSAPVVQGEQVSGKRADDNIREQEKSEGRAQEHMAKYDKRNHELNGKEITVSSNIDVREIADGSGIDLFDDKCAAQLQHSSVDYVTPEGSEQPSYKLEENSDLLELTIPSRERELEHGGISDQAPYSEEIIWKQIDAMRTIVGYTAAQQGTYTEELKALYVFTGVEPPASFKDPSDLAEVSDKLRFLMSIVGVQ